MTTAMVADLTVDEFKDLVREVVTQTIADVLSDPDEGLALREDLRNDLQQSLAAARAGIGTTPAEAVAARLGLGW
jgi:hypothetical protein